MKRRQRRQWRSTYFNRKRGRVLMILKRPLQKLVDRSYSVLPWSWHQAICRAWERAYRRPNKRFKQAFIKAMKSGRIGYIHGSSIKVWRRPDVVYLNDQLYAECQLVSALNACRFLRLPHPEPGSPDYEEMVDDVRARHGGCIYIERAHEFLGLAWIVRKDPSPQWIRRHLPVEMPLHVPQRGFHSVLAVRADARYVWLANYARGRLHRMTWARLEKLRPVKRRMRTMRSYMRAERLGKREGWAARLHDRLPVYLPLGRGLTLAVWSAPDIKERASWIAVLRAMRITVRRKGNPVWTLKRGEV